MKRSAILIFLILILSIQSIQAGGVGIAPAKFQEFFEPNLTKTYIFNAFSTDPERGVNTYVKGDLAQYVTLSEAHLTGGGRFTATINLPEKIEKPGTHTILIGVIEADEKITETVGAIAAIQGRIDIIVPYPGKYAESTFQISDINQGEEAPYEMKTQNLGTEPLSVKAKVDLYKINSTEKILTEEINPSTLNPKEYLTIKGDLKTSDLPPGEYLAIATIDWGKEEILNSSLRVGQFLVEILDYDYQFEKGKINPFTIQIQNKWNTKIDEVYASVSITDEGRVVGDFKTVTVETSPWEIKNITGYFDTTNLEPKRYIARIEISFAGEKTSKLVAIYVNEPPEVTYRKYIIAAIILVILIIAAFAYLIWKVKTLEKQNEKKKK